MARLKEMNQYLYLTRNKFIKIRRQSYFPFLVLCLVSGVICLVALRHNNTTMIRLRNDVFAADRNNGNVEGALDKLRAYVYSHMNTNLSTGTNIKPPIQLEYTYARLQQQAEQQANNSQVYTDAENYCQQQIPASISISGRGRIGCVQDYVLSHGGKAAANIPPALYEFDFVSPSWSPDLAGWSLLATIIFATATTATFLRNKLHQELRQ